MNAQHDRESSRRRCATCKALLPVQDRGRLRVTCSPACRQELYRRRRRERLYGPPAA